MKIDLKDIDIIIKDGTFFIGVSEKKNRLYVRISGFLSQETQVLNYLKYQTIALAKLKPGFTLIVNLGKYYTLPQEFIALQIESQNDLIKAGIVKVAEILPKSPTAVLQIKDITRQTGMPNHYCDTIEEAEAYLDANYSFSGVENELIIKESDVNNTDLKL